MSGPCKECGQVKTLRARGLCKPCYERQLFAENPEYAATKRAREAERARVRRKEDAVWAEAQRERDRNRTRTYGGNCELCGDPGIVAKGLCRRCYSRTWAQKWRASGAASTDASRLRAAEKARQNLALIAEAKRQPCDDCGRAFPQCAMDFDHVRGEKLFSLNSVGDRTTEALLREMAKCDLVCAVCHRIRTCNRRADRERCQLSHASGARLPQSSAS